MSREQVLYSQALVAARRNALIAGHDGGTRSFRRVLAILGLGATAAAAWYGALHIYKWYNEEVNRTSSEAFSATIPPDSNQNETDLTVAVIPTKSEIEVKRNATKVTLYQCPRGYYTPCVAPFPLKLETFLRVAKIPYEVDFSNQMESNKSPWMTVDGIDIMESHDCIPTLCEKFGVDLEKDVQQQSRRTASRLVGIMLDNHVYWGIALWRWVYDAGRSIRVIQPLAPVGQEALDDVGASVTRACWYHGLGRLTESQVIDLIFVDLSDLSAALGNHEFFLGNQPGEVDCSAFSMLSQMVWNMPNSPFEQAIKKYTNLVNFVLRMRERYWSDWDETLQKPGEVQLTDKLFYPTAEFAVTSRPNILAIKEKIDPVQEAVEVTVEAIEPPQEPKQYTPTAFAPQFVPITEQSYLIPTEQPAFVQAQPSSSRNGPAFPIIAGIANNPVVNQDEAVRHEQDERTAMLEQHIKGLRSLSHDEMMAKLRSFNQETNNYLSQQRYAVDPNYYHGVSQAPIYPTQTQFEPSPLNYAMANANGQFGHPTFIPSNPFAQPQVGYEGIGNIPTQTHPRNPQFGNPGQF